MSESESESERRNPSAPRGRCSSDRAARSHCLRFHASFFKAPQTARGVDPQEVTVPDSAEGRVVVERNGAAAGAGLALVARTNATGCATSFAVWVSVFFCVCVWVLVCCGSLWVAAGQRQSVSVALLFFGLGRSLRG